MKKIIAMLLALMMVLSLSLAIAEGEDKEHIYYDDSLSFAMKYPDGYKADSFVNNGVMLITISNEKDANAAEYTIAVAPDFEYEELDRLNDLSEDELNAFAESLQEDLGETTVEFRETGLGSKLVVIHTADSEADMAILASIYHGYLLVTYVTHADGSQVTPAEIDAGIQIYTDMDFIE